MAEEPSPPAQRSATRDRLWQVVFEAETKAGKIFDIVLLWAIGLSVVAVMLESVDSVATKWGELFFVLEWVFTILFMGEYFLRIWLVRKPKRYVFSFFGIIDFLSWIPTFVGLLFPGAQTLLVIRILRLLRMFRVLKMVGHVRGANTIMRALVVSRDKIMVFFFTMLVIAILMGTVAHLVESGSNPSFSSIPESVYWAIMTVTTIGYGDLVPITTAGKLLASFCGLLGYCIIAVPTGIVIGETVRASIRQQDETTSACPSCGVHGHLLDAKFCRRCGEDLSPPEPEPDPEESTEDDPET